MYDTFVFALLYDCTVLELGKETRMRWTKMVIAIIDKLCSVRNQLHLIYAKGAMLSVLDSFLYMKVLPGFWIYVAACFFLCMNWTIKTASGISLSLVCNRNRFKTNTVINNMNISVYFKNDAFITVFVNPSTVSCNLIGRCAFSLFSLRNHHKH